LFSGPGVELVTAVVSDSNSHDSLLKEADVLSTVVEHKFTTVVLSDVDYDTFMTIM